MRVDPPLAGHGARFLQTEPFVQCAGKKIKFLTSDIFKNYFFIFYEGSRNMKNSLKRRKMEVNQDLGSP